MGKQTKVFELTKSIDRYLAAISKLYAHNGDRQLQEIIVNSQTRVHEEWTYDGWDGGQYGHALYLIVPESLFFGVKREKEKIQARIKDDINEAKNIRDEFIAEVFLEIEVGEDHDWRKESGLLLAGKKIVTPKSAERIWVNGGFRVFLSHKSEVKKETSDLKDQLAVFGISCFVAHEDIQPTQEWQDEIENALSTMDGFVALMTEGFHDSNWTDQEVGFAFARGVPIIAVRMGKDPYGFIGKFQALSCSWSVASENIIGVLIRHDRMFNAYIQALRLCSNYTDGNTLGKALPSIKSATTTQIDELVSAYNENNQLQISYRFNGQSRRNFGPGLVSHLNRLGTRKFEFVKQGSIEVLRQSG